MIISFVLSCHIRPVTTNVSNAVKQSQLEAKTCYRHQARETRSNAFQITRGSRFCVWLDEIKACLLWLGSQNVQRTNQNLTEKHATGSRNAFRPSHKWFWNLFIGWNKGTLAVIKILYRVQETPIFIINRCHFVTVVSDNFYWFLFTERSKIILNECEKSLLIRNNSKLTMKMIE